MKSHKVGVEETVRLVELLADVNDPRVEGRVTHPLLNIMVMTICGLLSGAESVTDIVLFAELRKEWLRKFLNLDSGIPSHDTFARVLSLIDASEVETCFTKWVSLITGNDHQGDVISIDGKITKGTFETMNRGAKPFVAVSVYSHKYGLTLAETQSQSSGSSEQVAAQELIECLDLKGSIVTLDAAYATRSVMDGIRAQKGHFVIAFKRNNRKWLEQIESEFIKRSPEVTRTEGLGHGREERRSVRLLPVGQMPDEFINRWPEVRSIVEITRERGEKDKRYGVLAKGGDPSSTMVNPNYGHMRSSTTVHYYVSSRKLTAAQAQNFIRSHWLIENQVHWILDTAFNEDNYQIRSRALARSLSLLRKVALNLIKSSNTSGSVRGRIKKAGWDTKYLEKILFDRVF